MPALEPTVQQIAEATSWDLRVARIRQVPQRHGTDEHAAIYAEVARRLYVPHLGPDFAYVHHAEFYELPHFLAAYEKAAKATSGFTMVTVEQLQAVLAKEPTTLLVFRTITGLTRGEFAASTTLVAEPSGPEALSASKVDAMERHGSAPSASQAKVTALTIDKIMSGTLFGEPPGALKSKQSKPDSAEGWTTVAQFAGAGVPYSHLLHQRHYGGSFRQVLDATSTLRGNLIEDAVEDLFRSNGIPYIRTSYSQADKRAGSR